MTNKNGYKADYVSRLMDEYAERKYGEQIKMLEAEIEWLHEEITDHQEYAKELEAQIKDMVETYGYPQ